MRFEESGAGRMGILVGRIRGIEVWIHWILLALLALQLVSWIVARGSIGALTILGAWAISSAVLVASILFHELSHCWCAYRVGGGAHRIVLWPLGGLAFCDVPPNPRAQFAVSGAGPLANIAISAVAAGICLAWGWGLLPFVDTEGIDPFRAARYAAQSLFLWNAFLALLNLIPCGPQDGGRMLHSILWAATEDPERATAVVRRIGHAAAIAAAVASLAILVAAWLTSEFAIRHPFLGSLQWGLLFVAVMHLVHVRTGGDRYAAEPDRGVFGYDFSRGYTSLERTVTREARRASVVSSFRSNLRRRAEARRRREEAETTARVDELLEKIHLEGIDSLSRQERRFLVRASRRYRKSPSRKSPS